MSIMHCSRLLYLSGAVRLECGHHVLLCPDEHPPDVDGAEVLVTLLQRHLINNNGVHYKHFTVII